MRIFVSKCDLAFRMLGLALPGVLLNHMFRLEFASVALKFGDPRPRPRSSGTSWGRGQT